MLDVTFNDPIGKQDNSDRWSYFLLDIDTFQQKGTHTLTEQPMKPAKEIYTGRTVGQKKYQCAFCRIIAAKRCHRRCGR